MTSGKFNISGGMWSMTGDRQAEPNPEGNRAERRAAKKKQKPKKQA